MVDGAKLIAGGNSPAPDEGPSGGDKAMQRYSDGDDGAFSEVYDDVAPRLLNWLGRHTKGDGALAQDVVQSTLLCMHDARGRFIRGARVLPWAYTIARRVLIDALRKRHGEVCLSSSWIDEGVEPEAEGLADAADAARRMANAFGTLPARTQEAFSLMRAEGLSLKETAEVLGTTVTAVKLRVHRASKALHAAMNAVVGARGA